MKILVTGPDGFVGSAVCSQLISDSLAVRGAQWKAAPLAEGCESAVVGNIDGSTDWSQALEGIDSVVHLAARVHIMDDTAEDPLAAFREVNTEGTRHLAEEAAKAGVKRFVFISSIKVNGEATQATEATESPVNGEQAELAVNSESLMVNSGTANQQPNNQQLTTNNFPAAFSEREEPAPEDPYGLSKYEAEMVLREISERTGLEVVILRPPLLYGPGVKANFARLISIVDKGIPLPLGGIKNARSLLGLSNFADLISKCVTDPRAAGQTFTVCDGDAISTGELVRRIAKALGRKPRLVNIPEPLMRLAGTLTGKSAQVDRLCGSLVIDSSHVRKTLDWKPPVSMKQELAKVAEYYLGSLRSEV